MKTLRLTLLILIVLVFLSIILVNLVNAAEGYEIQVEIPGGLAKGTPVTNIGDYIRSIFRFGLIAIGLVAFGAIVVGAVQYTISAGNDSKIKEGKDRILHGVYGLVLLLLSVLILGTINPDIVSLREPGAPPVTVTGITPPAPPVTFPPSSPYQGYETEIASIANCIVNKTKAGCYTYPGSEECKKFDCVTFNDDNQRECRGVPNAIQIKPDLYCLNNILRFIDANNETWDIEGCNINSSLKNKLCQLREENQTLFGGWAGEQKINWYVTEAWPPEPNVHKDPGHYTGCAVDIALEVGGSKGISNKSFPSGCTGNCTDDCAKIKDFLDAARKASFGTVRNEYNCPILEDEYGEPSSGSKGGHIHLRGC